MATQAERRWRQEHKEYLSEQKRAWAAANREKTLASQRAYRRRNRARLLIEQATRRAANREKLRLANREYRQRNAENIRAKRAAQDKEKARAYHRNYQLQNRERIQRQRKEYGDRTREIRLEKQRAKYRANPDVWRQYAVKHKDSIRQRNAEHKRKNRAYFTALENARRALQLSATPPWFDPESTRSIYLEARRLTLDSGIQHDVDHIVPLKNDKVCGLHVAWNLRVITHVENIRKHNRFTVAA